MGEITIQKQGEKWFAFYENRKVAGSLCKNCIIKALMNITGRSNKYTKIVVLNVDGTVEKTLQTGAGI